MKIRAGFISNSSSSSFIVYGLQKRDLPEDITEKFNNWDDNWAWEYGDSDSMEDEEMVIGKQVTSFNDGYTDHLELDLTQENLKKAKFEIKDMLKNEFDYDVPDRDLRLIGLHYYS